MESVVVRWDEIREKVERAAAASRASGVEITVILPKEKQ
jgi:hypothetical protein